MKPITLEDLRPQPAEFYLRKTDRTYPLRAIGLEDEVWLRSTFGDRLKEIMAGTDMDGLGRIVWRLMREEDRQSFPASEIQETDESGDTRTVRKGGVALLVSNICGLAEKLCIYNALMQTIGISKPILDELMQEELKKNWPAGMTTPSVGEMSSMLSHPSTAGRSIISGNSPREKSPSPSGKSESGKAISSRSKRPSTASKSRSSRTRK